MDRQKFDTCKFRSETEINAIKNTCCYQITIYGFYCSARDLYKLNPNICITCDLYKAKETAPDSEAQRP